mmetsp:Transcript_37724/g.94674  ORF Transcript_37724/g.94674 Transcript_37724/m.94674 type:complete len:104 (+) Transcript_37724:1516-1827(+)
MTPTAMADARGSNGAGGNGFDLPQCDFHHADGGEWRRTPAWHGLPARLGNKPTTERALLLRKHAEAEEEAPRPPGVARGSSGTRVMLGNPSPPSATSSRRTPT